MRKHNYWIKTGEDIEKFTAYSYGPFDYMDTGTSPLSFYQYPAYRKPYMYPFKYYQSYPYPHMSFGEMNI